MRTDVAVFETGLLYEADMVAEQFKQLQIPHFRRITNFSGFEFAMPVMAAPGPGVIFRIMVPQGAASDAQAMVAELGFQPSQNCDVWGFHPRPWAKRMMQIYAYVVLGIIMTSMIWQLFSMLEQSIR